MSLAQIYKFFGPGVNAGVFMGVESLYGIQVKTVFFVGRLFILTNSSYVGLHTSSTFTLK